MSKKIINKMLEHCGMSECKIANTPPDNSNLFEGNNNKKTNQKLPYRQLACSLLYV